MTRQPYWLFVLTLFILCLATTTLAQIPGIGPVSEITRAQTGFQFTEGPAADLQGNIYFSDVQRNRIHKIDTQGNLTTFLENQPGVNGLMFDPRGRLIACQTGRIVAIEIATKNVTVIANRFENTAFQGPNDLVVDRQGNIYFSDRTGNVVYFIAADGTVKRLITNLSLPNGVLLSLDEKTLYVLHNAANVMAYPSSAPGQLGEPRTIALQGAGGGDGMTIDAQGNLYVTRPNSNALQVLKPTGESLGSFAFPETPSNCVFGGADMKTLFVTARTSVYTARMQAIGYRFASPVVSLSAASFATGAPLARESIVALFGNGLAAVTHAYTLLPLPTMLEGVTVKVTDSANAERLAALFFASPTQVNYQMPPGTADGPATVTVTTLDGSVFTEGVRIAATAPGLFSANANGQGVAIGLALRIKNGVQSFEPIARFDQTPYRWVSTPIEVGVAGEQVFLILFGTGARFVNTQANATVTIGGAPAELSFIGAQGTFVGLDQLNVALSPSLAGRGEMDVVLTIGAQSANAVRVNIK
jgi:gluconolactonase